MRKITILFVSLLLIVVIIYQLNNLTITTLNYFPIDSEVSFSDVATTIKQKQSDDQKPIICWQIQSTHEAVSYLDHDVGLLFRNGQLVSVQSKWSQQERQLFQETKLTAQPKSFYQAISYHYLELHQSEEQITSANQMSTAQLYVVNQNESASFETPKTMQEKSEAKKIMNRMNRSLENNWAEVIDYYSIDQERYDKIPLIELAQFKVLPLPGLTETDSTRVIAQLWEGLYKNYLLRMTEKQISGGYMPLIMIDKDHDHLLVLYTDHQGNHERLMQKLMIN